MIVRNLFFYDVPERGGMLDDTRDPYNGYNPEMIRPIKAWVDDMSKKFSVMTHKFANSIKFDNPALKEGESVSVPSVFTVYDILSFIYFFTYQSITNLRTFPATSYT